VWGAVCDDLHVTFDLKLLNYVLTKLYPASERQLLACHPRDLICMALDKAAYDERDGFEVDDLRWAWSNYFLHNESHGSAVMSR
jgi:hypothetical protein